jgi:hypothetical protein
LNISIILLFYLVVEIFSDLNTTALNLPEVLMAYLLIVLFGEVLPKSMLVETV